MTQSNTPSRTSANDEAHWRKTTKLMLIHLGIWVFFGYIIHMFVKPLNNIVIPVVDFPLGFYMAAQGSLIVFVVQLFLFAKQQNKIDREFGVAENERGGITSWLLRRLRPRLQARMPFTSSWAGCTAPIPAASSHSSSCSRSSSRWGFPTRSSAISSCSSRSRFTPSSA